MLNNEACETRAIYRLQAQSTYLTLVFVVKSKWSQNIVTLSVALLRVLFPVTGLLPEYENLPLHILGNLVNFYEINLYLFFYSNNTFSTDNVSSV